MDVGYEKDVSSELLFLLVSSYAAHQGKTFPRLFHSLGQVFFFLPWGESRKGLLVKSLQTGAPQLSGLLFQKQPWFTRG